MFTFHAHKNHTLSINGEVKVGALRTIFISFHANVEIKYKELIKIANLNILKNKKSVPSPWSLC